MCYTGGAACCQRREGTRGKDKGHAAVLNRAQERSSHLVEKVTFEQRSKGGERVSHEDMGKHFLSKGNSGQRPAVGLPGWRGARQRRR